MANEIHILRPEEFDFNGFGRMNKNSIAMIMTHNYNFDQQLLKRVLPLKLKYVGILGPRVRTQRILCDLAGEGTEFSSEELFSLHGPAGLDLGCETPGEIALSLIAEMMTVVSGRSGGFLRDRRSGIHSTVITEMAFA